MRKTITIGIFLFFTASISFSQKLSFGALVGLDLSKIQVVDTKKYTEDRNIYSPLWSCNANGYLSLKGKSFFGATIELGFIRKGGIRKNLSLRSEQIIFQPQTVSFYSNYIQVPIYADFYLLKKLTFSTGVDFDFLINSKVKSKLITFESSKEYDKIEISGNVKITFNLLKHVDIGLLYNHSITSSSYLNWVDDFYNLLGRSKQYNQYVQLMVRVRLK